MEVGDVILLPLHTTSQKLRKGLQVWPITGLCEKSPLFEYSFLRAAKKAGLTMACESAATQHLSPNLMTFLSLEPVR